jgi:hypothetical protein
MAKANSSGGRLRAAVIAVVSAVALTLAAVTFGGSARGAAAPQVRLTTSAHALTTTGSFTLRARTVHPVAGTDVVLQEKKPAGWHVVSAFPHHAGGRLHWSHPSKGAHRLRAVLEKQGTVLDISPTVVVRVTAPVRHTSTHTTSTSHSCTRTSTGSCIRGGEFCAQAMYGHVGYDSSGRSWRCTGDHTHPHWE